MEDAHSIAAASALPDDPAALRAMIATLVRERDNAAGERAAMRLRVDALELDKQHLEMVKLRLEVQLLRFKRWYYGPRADKLVTLDAVNQMLLSFGEALDARPVDARDLAVEEVTAPTPSDGHRRVRRGRGRRNLANFDNLPVTRCEHDLAEGDKLCPCCNKMRVKIGEESTWQIEYIPGRFERIEHVQAKYACTHCEQTGGSAGPLIERAGKPLGVIDKGLAGPGLLAYIVTSKFSDYLPLYRLEDIFTRGGFEIARSTMSLWCRDVAELVKPLYDLMVRRVLKSRVVATDDTIMPMLDPGAGKAAKARMWVYVGGVGDDDQPYNIFDFTISRSRDGPSKFLKGFKGTLLADAYGGYDGVVVESDIVRAGCWAHARRKFVDAQATNPAIAAEAVGLIKRLYAIENRGKEGGEGGEGGGLDAAARGELRRTESVPILAVLKDRLHSWREQLLPKHPMAQAAAYALNQWKELSVFAQDGQGGVPIDNNASEREMKRIVLNRKNSLFVGHERGGQTAAILSSLTSTCRRHAIDPQRYLTQLLTNLPATPVSELEQWLPDQWKRRDTPPPV